MPLKTVRAIVIIAEGRGIGIDKPSAFLYFTRYQPTQGPIV
jgi:hypothetical protein